MLVLLDDIKIRDEGTFLAYIDTTFKDVKLNSLEDFREFLLRTNEKAEFIVSDYETIADKSFAAKVLAILMDVSYIRENIKLSQM
ncbi:MAG: hypothetical protein IKP95_02085 [Ruminococcus sp.]|nr:hypothetical protein [Ruminococcus sp.]